jgi:2-methylaconitate cis-trans-isomerase PrpF
MRGGPSKGVFLEKRFLPEDEEKRTALILAIFGSPDARQIDGLGGADPLTSKVAIVAPSSREDADVDYTFGQVGIDTPSVGYTNNCGNLSAGVGVFAIDAGMLQAREPLSTVRIFNTNTNKLILAEIPVKNGKAHTLGDYQIDGAPGKGAEIRLTFCDPAGAVTGHLLPTGNAADFLLLENGKRIEYSMVDAGTLYAFIPASALGVIGTETPEQLEKHPSLLADIEDIRRKLAALLVEKGVVSKTLGDALSSSLKTAIVAASTDHVTFHGKKISHDDIDIVARIINPKKVHKAFAVTGAICISAAALMVGTVVNSLVKKDGKTVSRRIRIGHPQGMIASEVIAGEVNGQFHLTGVKVGRTARRIMDGFVYVPV